MSHALQVLFSFPNGGVWGNFVDDAVCLILGYLFGRHHFSKIHASMKELHKKHDERHQELLEEIRKI